ncbi:hypothetical protein, partial [Chitinivibrio alkaliphilus]|uniref:hypothetical protein n=1 Tax=Chitinivibrio alkaliphilus TaxID=1505232 RepID=UPI0012DDED88
MFDTRGDQGGRLDGHGDSLAVELRLSEDPRALSAHDIAEVRLRWNGSDYTYTTPEIVDDHRLYIRDNNITGSQAGDDAEITLVFEDAEGVRHERRSDVSDRIAPVVRAAAYERRENSDDILTVTFSKPVHNTGTATAFRVDRNITLEVVSPQQGGTEVTYEIPQGSTALQYGDSLWIGAGENIMDALENEQQSGDNERVEISYHRVTELTRAVYYDTAERPDGYINEIHLFFDAPLPEAGSIDTDKVGLPEHREMEILSATAEGQDRLILSVQQDHTVVPPNTATTSEDLLSIDAVALTDTLMIGTREDVQIEDRLAPVAVRARFLPADDAGQERLIDTLRVVFSEEVHALREEKPFELARNSGETYTLAYDGTSSVGASSIDFYVDFDDNVHFPEPGDSLWVYEAGEVTDGEANVQERNTVAVALEIGEFDPGFRVAITPTPYDMHRFPDDSLVLRVVEGRRPIPESLEA